ncbi:MAG: acetyl-CoA carboxylase biotin carboxylase subunit [Omnitrophica WOR_2 bacterium GWF2_43_52]|nr:MAG: acetyl-CoA carboxylase biotin carboxylase subunit [Omnitrophica WOR_2 bacterium GWA2_44_7]OGX15030.1 MAG: acetyl-CoA carboxylase biotin carboxylase subunit [Omnitrophica WOR_2 bacterium GWC2_44_8]OGX22587.1 MAG: acetyl-CoA carboxylase biotin carboxylase subunit [Omnitrophica WOR_2 bacterium GWF2_43_52]OGX53782.1 MAG: acetyl-CoA carboxylase biotin carboxylase subunit [Omnitrophica WOR_2 bacterium RIFOXYC2_FULL_43_9]HAH21406.1 acetyl-CoA carboxylase biotin carboxylase subunit [Candidatus 
MFSKVLIANRGEIAVRIIRACKELGIRTVAVYSQADLESLHVRLADEAICIGPAASVNSYLNIPSIISAAEITDVDAIHPGYGFLAENPHFAEICESCRITFIGPTPENIRLMGDKMQARDTMRKANIPIVPGSLTAVKNKDDALKIAKRISYPIIIKAAAGGGGKGMRVCHNDISLVSGLMTAQAEAEASFGNSNVYIEKYIERPRHIEIQLLADKYGHIIYLGERDCSIQRRHQKLIEESPSPAVDSKLRKRLGEAAEKAAREVKYISAGTIEFLLDEKNNFYFMEMNTRIQVEHPVTEWVTGIDIVKEQIKIAAGEKLKIRQDDVKLSGSSIECRINAEDYENNFMPCPGKIESLNIPGGPGVRVDSHVYQGYSISQYYDSLIAKLIVHGRDRKEALRIMSRALDEFVIGPIKTTIPFHKEVLKNPFFIKGDFSTNFINENFKISPKKEE